MAAFICSKNHPAMKHHPLPFLLLATCTFGFTTARAQQEPITPSRAVPVSPANTDPSKPPVADPTADPFVRDGKKTPPATPPEAIAPMNIYALLEYIEVPRDQWLTWSAANPIKGDATALRAEVQKWIAAGQAKPFELTCLPTKSGQRSVIESTVERRFPTDFQPAIPGQVPVAFDKRDAYFVFEWEPVIGPDLFVESNFALHLVSFCGEDLGTVAERKATQPGDGGQPRFVDQNTSQNITSVPSQPMLVQVTTPVDELGKARDVARLLVFYRTAPDDANPQTAPSPKPGRI